MEEKTLITDLTVGSVPKQLIRFATPLFFSGLLQTVYNMVDMIVVGQFVGSTGLAAVSIGGDILGFLMFIAMGLSNAGQMIISQYIGAGRRDRVTKLIGTMFTFILACSLAMTVLCFLLRSDILRWINTPEEAWADAMDYIVVCILGLFFIYGYNMVSAILRGMGDSKHPFLFIAIASVVNVVLDLLFVAVFRWGALGAALATVIGQGVSFVLAIGLLYKLRVEFGFDFKLKSFAIDRQMLAALLRLGIPMMIQCAAIMLSRLFISSWVNKYGVAEVAVNGIGHKLQMVTNVFAQAFSTAGGTMIAQCIGAEKYDRVPKVILVSFCFDAVIATALSLVTGFCPRLVFGLFTTDEAVMEVAFTFIPIAILMYASCAFRPPMFSLINGSGNSKMNLAVAILDGIVCRVGLALLMGLVFNMGIYGFWYGSAFSDFVPFFIGGVYYLSGRWKTRKYIIRE